MSAEAIVTASKLLDPVLTPAAIQWLNDHHITPSHVGANGIRCERIGDDILLEVDYRVVITRDDFAELRRAFGDKS